MGEGIPQKQMIRGTIRGTQSGKEHLSLLLAAQKFPLFLSRARRGPCFGGKTVAKMEMISVAYTRDRCTIIGQDIGGQSSGVRIYSPRLVDIQAGLGA